MIAQTQDIAGDIASDVEASDVELDRGPRGRERARFCAATRTVQPVSELIRFVLGPDGEAIPDLKSKLPGRGIWVTGTRGALGEAIKRRAFARGFKREVRLPPDFVDRTEQLLERSALDALAIAGKSGLVATGFTRAEIALADKQVVALLHAAEASTGEARRLDGAWHRQAGPLVVIGFLTSAQLDLALNRPNVIHAALLAGPASETFLARCRRLERFRTGDQHNQAGEAAPSLRPAGR